MENDAQRYLNALSDEELTKLVLRLGKYAENKGRKYRWRSGNRFDLPNGETIDSIVSLAIELVLTGKRAWESQTDPDLAEFLMDVIDSRLYHLATGLDNTVNSRVPAETDPSDLEPSAVTHPTSHRREPAGDWLSKRPRTPEQELIERESLSQREEAMRKLQEAVEGDGELTRILGAIKAGCDTDQQIAQFTELGIEKVRAAKKRMARRVDRLRSEFSEE